MAALTFFICWAYEAFISVLVDTQGELLADWIHTRDTGSVTPQTQTLIGQTALTRFKGALLT